uniref:C-type lectin domain-containing protein n=1 Tax=Pelusios castaneus TaxID=367368 RepID=A0A8C8RI59_9SAUR
MSSCDRFVCTAQWGWSFSGLPQHKPSIKYQLLLIAWPVCTVRDLQHTQTIVLTIQSTGCYNQSQAVFRGSRCKLCPENWRAHQGKCYWDSKGSKFWNESQKDCESRHSQMLVIQDQEDMDFIQNITDGINHVWIGLNITSHTRNWTWVDGSPFNHTLFPVSGHIASDSCGVVKGNQINSETCSAEFKWICQKDAVVV